MNTAKNRDVSGCFTDADQAMEFNNYISMWTQPQQEAPAWNSSIIVNEAEWIFDLPRTATNEVDVFQLRRQLSERRSNLDGEQGLVQSSVSNERNNHVA